MSKYFTVKLIKTKDKNLIFKVTRKRETHYIWETILRLLPAFSSEKYEIKLNICQIKDNTFKIHQNLWDVAKSVVKGKH